MGKPIRRKKVEPKPDGPWTTNIQRSREEWVKTTHLDKMQAVLHCARQCNDWPGQVLDPNGNVIAEFRPDTYTAIARDKKTPGTAVHALGQRLQKDAAERKAPSQVHDISSLPKKKIIRKAR